MRTIDIARMALGNLRRKWMLAPLAFLVISTVCLCYAGAIDISVGAKKQKPCELTVTAPNNGHITEQVVADITKIPDVTAATAVLPIQATLKTGGYTAASILLGVDRYYLQGPYDAGGGFPGDTIMPYIVLTKTGATSFIDPKDPPSPADTDYIPDIDWPNTPTALYLGGDMDTKPIISKVCGILTRDSDTQAAAGYIDIATAKTLLRNHKMPVDVTSAIVRIKNIGTAEAVSRQIRTLGYDVAAPNTQLQAKWDGQVKEMSYLLWIGGICFICAALLMAAALDAGIAGQQNELNMLRWMGMRQSMIRQMYVWQSAIIGTTGAILGVLIGYLIPAFISVEQKPITNFSLPIPPLVAAAIGLLCIIISVLPGIYTGRKKTNESQC